MLGKIRLFDKSVGPDLSQQFIFSEQASSILNQDQQSVERFRGQLHRRLLPQQESFGGIQAKAAEFKNGFCL
jgi:hypothetical protein